MGYDNNATQLRRVLMIHLALLAFKGKLADEIDALPIKMRPKSSTPASCCVYHERALIKYRTMALLGAAVEDEVDELKPLSAYAREALARDHIEGPILTVLGEACNRCVQSTFYITDACRSCLARPCTMECVRGAIRVIEGRAVIDAAKCARCGKCMEVCPYHAIVYVPIPCEEACPVGALKKKGAGGVEELDQRACIQCGKCMRACPFGAIMDRSQIIDVIGALSSSHRVSAIVAPAIIGQFDTPLEQIIAAISELGFDQVYETARGADVVAVEETNELRERLEKGEPFMTSSCCPAYLNAVKKHMPDLQPYVSHSPTPMHVTAGMAAQDDPEAIRVFISPCVGKKSEALDDPLIDYVLTFEELEALFIAAGVDTVGHEPLDTVPASGAGRNFAVSGGVWAAISSLIPADPPIEVEIINGLTKKDINRLKVYPRLKKHAQFIEVMTCENGCIGGPCVIGDEKRSAQKVAELAAGSPPLVV